MTFHRFALGNACLFGEAPSPPVSDGFAGVRAFLRDLSSDEDRLVGVEWIKSKGTLCSGEHRPSRRKPTSSNIEEAHRRISPVSFFYIKMQLTLIDKPSTDECGKHQHTADQS